MTCKQPRDLVGTYFDAELVGEERAAMEAHLGICQVCAAELDELTNLREKLTRIERPLPPSSLANRIRAELAREAGKQSLEPIRSFKNTQYWLPVSAAATAAGVLVTVITWAALSQFGPPARLEHDALGAHLRSLVQDSQVQVASSDSHVVKPWFAGRVDFAPTVKDLTAEGYPLIGGRLDYLGDRRVGTLVYKRRNHVVSLFMWATSDHGALAMSLRQASTIKGHNMLSWTSSGITYWAISDLNAKELAELQKLL